MDGTSPHRGSIVRSAGGATFIVCRDRHTRQTLGHETSVRYRPHFAVGVSGECTQAGKKTLRRPSNAIGSVLIICPKRAAIPVIFRGREVAQRPCLTKINVLSVARPD